MGSLFETLMLVCFGLSWPINMMKAYKARTAKGTSLPFLLLIITGYLGGIAAKIISGNINKSTSFLSEHKHLLIIR